MDTILYDSTDGVCTITLNRPESYNAVNEQLSTELLHALTQAETDAGVRCVVLTGAGKAFCSGRRKDFRFVPTAADP